MSGRGTGSGGRRSSSNAASRPSTSRASEVAGPSTHRFADRRQERMRGAGTAVAMQRDFQFKLPAKKSAPSTSATARAPAASTGTQDTSVSTENSETRRRPGRPRGSGPRQKERAAAAAAAAAAASAESSPDVSVVVDADTSLLPDQKLNSSRPDASTSIGVPRRVARPHSSAPISSTPAPSRIQKPSLASASRASQRNARDADEDVDSQLGDEDDYSLPGGGAALDASPGWDAGLDDMDESLPVIPSPAASSSHVDTSVRRTRPSVGGASVSRLSIADSPSTRAHVDSPAARAAKRSLDARQRRRQGSPGTERHSAPTEKRRGRPPKSAVPAKSRSRALLREPVEQDETVMDRTMIERHRGGAVGGPARSGRDLQKRLKRALTLVYSATDADEGDEAGAPSAKKRKSGKYLNDVDIIWSVVDEELRSAIEEQPAKAPFLALKALRKSVRSNFLNLSEKTDSRTTLISQLVRARKQKRQLRKEVFACRSELAKSTAEAGERTREMNDWKKEVTDVRKVNAFLLNLRHQAAAWT
ncbi:hypothetical protein PANT_8c00008 [Moesziomyces antarcticus T-34]|uniref:Uncharacterized protein n=1 Tax=Pseudozyma antarctica (strain T-34) TaxID=1151754 RepID=M9LZU7_PSEA3|nr:hypothetical protein PANT_8c00008 [Moesziomyces antarcticus T-34]